DDLPPPLEPAAAAVAAPTDNDIQRTEILKSIQPDPSVDDNFVPHIPQEPPSSFSEEPDDINFEELPPPMAQPEAPPQPPEGVVRVDPTKGPARLGSSLISGSPDETPPIVRTSPVPVP